jgi:PAS domain S-box-containing protein
MSIHPPSDQTSAAALRAQMDAREREWRLSEERFRAAFDCAAIGMTMTAVSGRFLRANQAFCECLGYEEHELVDKLTFLDVTHPDDWELDRGRMADLLSGRCPNLRGDKRYLRRDGATVLVEISVSLVRDEAGRPLHFLSQVLDVTEQRRVAADLRRSNAELQHFASSASHDLNEPLRIIDGYLQLLSARYGPQLDDEGRQFIGFATDASARMRELIDALLRYARVGSGDPVMVPLESGELVREAEEALSLAIAERGAVLEIGDLPAIQAEPTLLGQVFQNLLANAVRLADERAPRVVVTATRRESAVEFSVRDNGPGIAPEERERIFEMFQRGRHGQGSERSAGIGLAICKRAVERHGGRIWAQEAPGGGADLRFTIPVQARVKEAA